MLDLAEFTANNNRAFVGGKIVREMTSFVSRKTLVSGVHDEYCATNLSDAMSDVTRNCSRTKVACSAARNCVNPADSFD